MTIYRTSIIRADLNLYRQMLDELRNDEQEAGVENSVSYLIDVAIKIQHGAWMSSKGLSIYSF